MIIHRRSGLLIAKFTKITIFESLPKFYQNNIVIYSSNSLYSSQISKELKI